MADAVDWSQEHAPTSRPLTASQLSAYCSRIGLPPLSTPTLAPDAAFLAAVVGAHASTIPFESFDVRLGRHISLSPDGIFDKLVTRRRGGFCLETSLLLCAALQSLGFSVRLRAARVWMRLPAPHTPLEPPNPRQHLVLIVRAGGGSGGGGAGDEWLVDVGFGGGGPACPLPLRSGAVVTVGGDVFRVDAGDASVGEDPWLLRGVVGGVLTLLYSFEHTSWDAPRVDASDFLLVSHWVQRSKGSLFHAICVASLPRPDGRTTLLGRDLRVKGVERLGTAPTLTVTRVEDAVQYARVAEEHFGIVLTSDEARVLFEAAA